MSCRVKSSRVVLSFRLSCVDRAALCCIVLCHVMSCCAVLCCVVLCRISSCRVVASQLCAWYRHCQVTCWALRRRELRRVVRCAVVAAGVFMSWRPGCVVPWRPRLLAWRRYVVNRDSGSSPITIKHRTHKANQKSF